MFCRYLFLPVAMFHYLQLQQSPLGIIRSLNFRGFLISFMRAPSDFAVPYKFSHLWFRFRIFLMTFIPVILHLKGLNFCEQEFQKSRRFLISQYFSKEKFYTDENLELLDVCNK